MLVAELPAHKPIITVHGTQPGISKKVIAIGELLEANCVSGPSYPPVNFTWIINGNIFPVSKKFLHNFFRFLHSHSIDSKPFLCIRTGQLVKQRWFAIDQWHRREHPGCRWLQGSLVRINCAHRQSHAVATKSQNIGPLRDKHLQFVSRCCRSRSSTQRGQLVVAWWRKSQSNDRSTQQQRLIERWSGQFSTASRRRSFVRKSKNQPICYYSSIDNLANKFSTIVKWFSDITLRIFEMRMLPKENPRFYVHNPHRTVWWPLAKGMDNCAEFALNWIYIREWYNK